MFSVGNVQSILRAHKKTIRDLGIRKEEILKNERELLDRQQTIIKVLAEAEKERKQAEAAEEYLGGLFKAIEEA